MAHDSLILINSRPVLVYLGTTMRRLHYEVQTAERLAEDCQFREIAAELKMARLRLEGALELFELNGLPPAPPSEIHDD